MIYAYYGLIGYLCLAIVGKLIFLGRQDYPRHLTAHEDAWSLGITVLIVASMLWAVTR